jgi:hypothetical protein
MEQIAIKAWMPDHRVAHTEGPTDQAVARVLNVSPNAMCIVKLRQAELAAVN